MKKIKLTDWEKAAVKAWIINDDSDKCPFWKHQGDDYCYQEGELCKKFFPEMELDAAGDIGIVGICPCNQFGFDAVVERAKEILKTGGIKNALRL